MMAQKALLFEDYEVYKRIMSTVDPSDQKRFGREVRNFEQDVWGKHAKDFVYDGSYAKFTQNEDLKKVLLATEGTTLVEASPEDTIWGIGLRKDDPWALKRETWCGTNWLGEVLTRVREDII